jgi:hypothetical protein
MAGGERFQHPDRTATGEARAKVALSGLSTLWFDTGTVCNLACPRCYIESSPANDRLAPLGLDAVAGFLDEIHALGWRTGEIGFTGGEPFLNPALMAMLELCLERGFRVLVLTNGLRPLANRRPALLALNAAFPGRLGLRLSLDHYRAEVHDRERGPGTFAATTAELVRLAAAGVAVTVAGRTFSGESESGLRAGYAALFAALGLGLEARDPRHLVLFAEMDPHAEVPEVTERCWDLLGRSPDSVMCAWSRMVVKRRGAERPVVVSCTLLPYDPRFELGPSLAESARPVALNHPHCARFCVLGGSRCSG